MFNTPRVFHNNLFLWFDMKGVKGKSPVVTGI